MPTIVLKDGIRISMFFGNEHEPPHIHAYYAEYSIKTAERIEGFIPGTKERTVKSYIRNNTEYLLELWNTNNEIIRGTDHGKL